MKGKRRFRVLVGISYPTAPGVVRRILAGEDVPFSVRREHYAKPGEVVDDLPEHSIPSLLAKGRVVELDAEDEGVV